MNPAKIIVGLFFVGLTSCDSSKTTKMDATAPRLWTLDASVELVYDSGSENPVDSPIHRIQVSLAGPSNSWEQVDENVSRPDLEGLYTEYSGISSFISVSLEMKSGDTQTILNTGTHIRTSIFVSNGRVMAEGNPMDMVVIRTEEVVPFNGAKMPLDFVFGHYEATLIEEESLPVELSFDGVDLRDFSIGRGPTKWLYGIVESAAWKLKGEQGVGGQPATPPRVGD